MHSHYSEIWAARALCTALQHYDVFLFPSNLDDFREHFIPLLYQYSSSQLAIDVNPIFTPEQIPKRQLRTFINQRPFSSSAKLGNHKTHLKLFLCHVFAVTINAFNSSLHPALRKSTPPSSNAVVSMKGFLFTNSPAQGFSHIFFCPSSILSRAYPIAALPVYGSISVAFPFLSATWSHRG